jgi:hypothetical protein
LRYPDILTKGIPEYFPVDCRKKVSLLQTVNLALLDKSEVNPGSLLWPARSCDYVLQSHFAIVDRGSLSVSVGPCLGLIAFSKSGSRVAAFHLEAVGDDNVSTHYSSGAVQGMLNLFRYVIGSPVETIITFSVAQDILQFHEFIEYGLSEVFKGVTRFQLTATQVCVNTRTAQLDAMWVNSELPIPSSMVRSIWNRN